MIVDSMLALLALGVFSVLLGFNGLMRNTTKNIRGVSRKRKGTATRVREFIGERKWGIGLLVLFGMSGAAIGVISNIGTAPGGTTGPDEQIITPPDFTISGSNPNLTREGYPVTLSKWADQVSEVFNPAIRGTGGGARSVWGLCVDEMRVAYYGADNQWHETSFQINEKGYRWMWTGDTDSLGSERDENPNGERPRTAMEQMEWQNYYVPDTFFPTLDTKFFPDGPYVNKGNQVGGVTADDGAIRA
jgi:hypothetical protein